VESLLAQEGKSEGFLEQPALELAARELAADERQADPPTAALVVDTMLSRYRVIGKLGVGGMGVVYQAGDTRLNRPVALKFLPSQLAGDRRALERFEREPQVLASLSHPNIVSTWGFEESSGTGILACALGMEFVAVPTLADRIARSPIPIDEARSPVLSRPLSYPTNTIHLPSRL
jgi:serine/threonine protein kinase